MRVRIGRENRPAKAASWIHRIAVLFQRVADAGPAPLNQPGQRRESQGDEGFD